MKTEDDCVPCRVVGATVLLGTGAYCGLESYRTHARGSKFAFGAISAVFVFLGVYRAITPVKPLDK